MSWNLVSQSYFVLFIFVRKAAVSLIPKKTSARSSTKPNKDVKNTCKQQFLCATIIFKFCAQRHISNEQKYNVINRWHILPIDIFIEVTFKIKQPENRYSCMYCRHWSSGKNSEYVQYDTLLSNCPSKIFLNGHHWMNCWKRKRQVIQRK